MKHRPESWQGVPVPYGASVDDLADLIRGTGEARWAAFEALARTPGEPALRLLRESSSSPDPHVRRAAVEALGAHSEGRGEAKVILGLLSDSHDFVVRSACTAAAQQRLIDAHDRVLQLVDAESEATQVVALQALRVLWRTEDFERVFREFRLGSSDKLRKEAAWTLRQHASSSVWRTLFDEWRMDALARHRGWACELAGEFGDAHCLRELSVMLDDADGHVRDRAAEASSRVEARVAGK